MDFRLNILTAAGRILLSLIFVIDGFEKFGSPARTVGQMAGHGLPFAGVLVWAVIALEFGGGLLLLTGLFTRWIACAYAVYIVVLAFMFHPYWGGLPADQVRAQHTAFYEHLGLVGGMLYVMALGAGDWSLDGWLRRQTQPASVALFTAH